MTISVELSKMSEFLAFEVIMNELPVEITYGEKSVNESRAETDVERGKDIVIDWEFLDGFNTGNNLWVDANGLFMKKKRLWERSDFKYTKSNNIASNFYPV